MYVRNVGLLLCDSSLVIQFHDQDSLDLILPSSLIWNLIRVMHLRCLITRIYLVSARLESVQDVVVEQNNFVLH